MNKRKRPYMYIHTRTNNKQSFKFFFYWNFYCFHSDSQKKRIKERKNKWIVCGVLHFMMFTMNVSRWFLVRQVDAGYLHDSGKSFGRIKNFFLLDSATGRIIHLFFCWIRAPVESLKQVDHSIKSIKLGISN